MIEEKETKKRRTVLMEVLIIKSNVNHIIKKIVNVESAINEAELNIEKLLDEFNKQKDQSTVLEGIIESFKNYLESKSTPQPKQPRQSSEVTLISVDKKYFELKQGEVVPTGFLPRQVWLDANNELQAKGYKWVKTGKKGSWKKQ